MFSATSSLRWSACACSCAARSGCVTESRFRPRFANDSFARRGLVGGWMEACESPRDQWQRLRQALRTATHQPNADRLQTIALVMEMVRSDELGPVQKECVQLARRLARQLG